MVTKISKNVNNQNKKISIRNTMLSILISLTEFGNCEWNTDKYLFELKFGFSNLNKTYIKKIFTIKYI
jgi:hypothetical protein